jgi:hypothetical protein
MNRRRHLVLIVLVVLLAAAGVAGALNWWWPAIRATAAIQRLGGSVVRELDETGHPVTSLVLVQLPVGDAELAGLPSLDGMPSPRLFLDGTQVTDNGLKGLKALGPLRELSIAFTRVTDRGLESLSGMDDLRVLNLKWCRAVTDAGLEPLKGMRGLKMVVVEGTGVTAKGLASLRRARPDLLVYAEPRDD